MRTTVRLNEALLEQAKKEAARRGITLTALLEQGLRLALARRPSAARRSAVKLPECNAGGGALPGVDLNDSAALLDRMDGRQ
ncbi:MAG: CopG family transcriptional regulator [Burkholderiales bacterium]